MSTDEAIVAQLREQTKWLRLLGLQALRPLLVEILLSDKQKLVYELSDGSRTVREIGKLAGVGPGTVSALWREWMAVGICTESSQRAGRAQHLAPMSRLGMVVPGLAKGMTATDSEGGGEAE
ncbi:MAG: hypothetical protein ACYCS9_06605 [Candidatus Dormibacteria bacterium]